MRLDREYRMLKKYLNVKELSGLTGLKQSTIYQWVSQRKIPYIKLGKKILFDPDKINKWIDENTVKVGM